MYVIGFISSIITNPRLRTLSHLLFAVMYLSRTKDSPILAIAY
jgi:hypothetical protein